MHVQTMDLQLSPVIPFCTARLASITVTIRRAASEMAKVSRSEGPACTVIASITSEIDWTDRASDPIAASSCSFPATVCGRRTAISNPILYDAPLSLTIGRFSLPLPFTSRTFASEACTRGASAVDRVAAAITVGAEVDREVSGGGGTTRCKVVKPRLSRVSVYTFPHMTHSCEANKKGRIE